MSALPSWHPLVVHFPIALVVVAGIYVWAVSPPCLPWPRDSVPCSIWM